MEAEAEEAETEDAVGGKAKVDWFTVGMEAAAGFSADSTAEPEEDSPGGAGRNHASSTAPSSPAAARWRARVALAQQRAAGRRGR
eukprot:4790042-Prymnesium_polylepis.2